MRLLDKAHNEYLQIAITTGIPTLFFYLLFIFFIIKKNIKYIRDNNLKDNKKKTDSNTDYNLFEVSTALFFGITAYWIQATFNISIVSVAPIYWGLTGLNLAIISIDNNSK
jgi:putative inorganic carbon (HCO3(-)) transporter